MKKFQADFAAYSVLFFAFVLGPGVFAQSSDSNTIPIVTVRATDSFASWPGDTGTFTVFRQGNRNLTLNVWYDVGGTASNGVDYARISNWVNIPAGATSNTIVIAPLTNPPPTIGYRTVVLTLTNSPLMTPVNYQIGSPSSAVVTLESINYPPPPGISSPQEGAVFRAPTNILILGSARGLVTNMEFFADATDLGKGFLKPTANPAVSLYSLCWSNALAGKHALTAVASYVGGVSATSAPVNITVLEGPAASHGYITAVLRSGCTSSPTPPPPVGGTRVGADYVIKTVADADPMDWTNAQRWVTDAIFESLMPLYCALPKTNCVTDSVQWNIITYDTNGNPRISGCAASGCQLHSCQGFESGPPVVRIISPANGTIFHAPVDIPLYAFAKDFAGSVVSVEFFAGTNSLGFGQPVPTPVTGALPPIHPTNVFFLVWNNAPVGFYTLTAQATDNDGSSNISELVKIAVFASPPPPTNRPPIVSIVASDPVAIEGTNDWVWSGETNATPTWAAWPAAACRFFTNCGPKTAMFTVRRFGDTNSDLTLPYDIGGAANNGVDYAALPGSVTIPAGERRALITIVPIDDGPPDVNKTVILTLLPDLQMNPLPGYVLGFPRRAAAVIIDSAGLRPVTGMLPDNSFHLVASGPDAAWFRVEYSTNLGNWTPICTNQVIHGSVDFIDPETQSNQARYYRIVPLDGPPAQ